jgi:heme/copper-type cytochrome/quinol oxidase subunit 2
MVILMMVLPFNTYIQVFVGVCVSGIVTLFLAAARARGRGDAAKAEDHVKAAICVLAGMLIVVVISHFPAVQTFMK